VDDRALRERLGKAARAGVDRYDWPRVAEEHLEYYRGILNGVSG